MPDMKVPETGDVSAWQLSSLKGIAQFLKSSAHFTPSKWPRSTHVEVQTRAQHDAAFNEWLKDMQVADTKAAATGPVLYPEPSGRTGKSDSEQGTTEATFPTPMGPPQSLSKADKIFDNDSTKYETQLDTKEEEAFQKWKKKYAPHDSGYDYDLRGAFKADLKPDAKSGHWPDTFKKPNHPTFSNESKYAKDRPDLAGHWEGNKYIPPKKKK